MTTATTTITGMAAVAAGQFGPTALLAVDGADAVTGHASFKQLGIVYTPQQFGAVGNGIHDDTAAFQAAITAAAGELLYVPAGSYLITSTLLYATVGAAASLRMRGAGMLKTTLVNGVANGPLLSVTGDAAGGFQYDMLLADFAIVPAASAPATSHGLAVRGVWLGSIERVSITNLSGDAIRITCTVGDNDSSSNIGITRCSLQNNTGWGVNCVSAVGVIAISFLSIEDCFVDANAAGGLKITSLITTIRRNSISQNGTTGISIPSNGIGVRFCRILENEFDTNTLSHINIATLLNGEIDGNWFKSFTGVTPPTGVIVGDGVHTVDSLVIRRNMVTLVPAASVYTAYSISASATYTRLEDNTFPSMSAPAVRYSDAGVGTFIRDGTGGRKERYAFQSFTLANGATATPDFTTAENLRLVVNGAAVTLAAPSGVAPDVAVELSIDIFNNTGGGITVTFNGAYHKAGYTDPAAGKRTTARFLYDPISAYYVQIGAWSPDI